MKLAIEFRIKKYIGKKAISKDNMKVGTIKGFHVKKKNEGEYTVDYFMAFGQYPNVIQRMINEKNIVILKNS